MVEKFKKYWCWEFSKNFKGRYLKNRQLILRRLIIDFLDDEMIENILKEMKKEGKEWEKNKL